MVFQCKNFHIKRKSRSKVFKLGPFAHLRLYFYSVTSDIGSMPGVGLEVKKYNVLNSFFEVVQELIS